MDATAQRALAGTSLVRRLYAGARRMAEASGLPLGYLICAPLALLAIWGHRFPPGVDLPEHAQVIRLGLDVLRGVPYAVNLYEIKPLTPYTLEFILAYPLAKWFGARAGLKFVLTLAALGVPWMMTRWLRVVGGDGRLGVIGFAVVFGYAFLWGFVSTCLGLAFLFAYLVAFEQQGDRPTVRQIVVTTCWGGALFFCHGVTFGLAVLCAGMRLVVRPRPLALWRAALHFIPLGVLTLYWLHLQEQAVSDNGGAWLMDTGRLSMLFSGLFCIGVNPLWAEITVGVLLVAGLFVRPRLSSRLAAWVPLLMAFVGFAVLPNRIASAWLIGPRFTVYVQAFAAGILLPRPGRWSPRFAWTPVALVVVCLLALNVRIYRFNGELEAYQEVAAKAEPGADVQAFMPNRAGESNTFGFRALATVPAWFTAEHGGLLEDDFAARFNLPLQRKKVSFPGRYRYIFSLVAAAEVEAAFPDAELRATSGHWSLFERTPQTAGVFTIVRSGQGWGDLAVDHSVVNEPLSVAGVEYPRGLGTHADSWIQLRAPAGKTTLEGACGLDDSGKDEAQIYCGVRPVDGRGFRSAPIHKGDPPVPFSVAFPEHADMILEIFTIGVNKGTHGDWIDLR